MWKYSKCIANLPHEDKSELTPGAHWLLRTRDNATAAYNMECNSRLFIETVEMVNLIWNFFGPNLVWTYIESDLM